MRLRTETDSPLLAAAFPERTVLVRSGDHVRYHRLGPRRQAGLAVAAAAVGLWTVVATGWLAVEAYQRAEKTEAAARLAAAYETRIAALEAARAETAAALDAAETLGAQAIAALTARHDALGAALGELERLRATHAEGAERLAALEAEAAAARAAAAEAEARRAEVEAALAGAEADRRDLAGALERIAGALETTAAERDDAAAEAAQVEGALGALEAGVEEERAAQARLLAQIEAAAQQSIGPLEEALGAAGVDVDQVLRRLRASDGGEGGPFVPAPEVMSALGPQAGAQAAAIMSDLERVTLLRAAVRRMPFAIPVSSPRITSGFGRRRDPFNFRSAMHEGLDFSGASGTPIYATAHGVVVFSGTQRGYGRMVRIRHDFGFETVYAHLSRTRVAVGDRVEPGARIGDMGNTGRSTGTHLHYEIRVNDRPVDPMTFIEAARDVL